MPNRPPPGYKYPRSQVGLDGIVSGLGGYSVQPDPTFSLNPDPNAEGPDEGTGEGSKTQTTRPFKKKGIFSGAATDRANQAYQQALLTGDIDTANKIKVAQAESILNVNAADQIDRNRIKNLPDELKIKLANQIEENNSQVLTSQKLLDTPGQRLNYGIKVQPEIFNKLATSAQNETAGNQLNLSKTQLEQDILDNTRDTRLNIGDLKANADLSQEQQNLKNIPVQGEAYRQSAPFNVKELIGKAASAGIIPIGQGGSLIPGASGQPAQVIPPLYNPTQQKSAFDLNMMQNIMGGGQTNNVNPLSTGAPRPVMPVAPISNNVTTNPQVVPTQPTPKTINSKQIVTDELGNRYYLDTPAQQ